MHPQLKRPALGCKLILLPEKSRYPEHPHFPPVPFPQSIRSASCTTTKQQSLSGSNNIRCVRPVRKLSGLTGRSLAAGMGTGIHAPLVAANTIKDLEPHGMVVQGCA